MSYLFVLYVVEEENFRIGRKVGKRVRVGEQNSCNSAI